MADPDIAANTVALAAASGLPPQAIDAAARQISHYISGTVRDPWPDPDLEDVLWAAEALKAAAPALLAVPQRLPDATRFEVIDGTRTGSHRKVTYQPQYVRSVVGLDVSVELSVQDEGRTLKVFLR